MKTNFQPAFKTLTDLGVPVYVHPDDDGNFSIDAEASGASKWVSYYGGASDWIFGVHPKVNEALRKCNLFAEWVNPGRLGVYRA
jgi:hypothetical protein